MWEVVLNLAAVIGLYGAVEYCLRGQSRESLDEASLIPFADDPEVARRVALATGKQVNAVVPEETKQDWGNVEI
ncbi:cbb3-type cytochrome c oxidase subunit 3 [Pseudomonas sp. K2I15]|uniref:cbb3-type cytochrome c oxidase subunit 3 n=1 Tax=unclassified Pseudomonas TaxID=196821 RepID=UPI000B4C4954|nr:cbb3-type cytochrome c oxidase subunit 3 [Pseudomonas sp. K2I15]OWP69933.1 CcoQ/FixQ family Cbb3-type cytochrome c oxidase assembly chaperone [Pseudomonas sp. K2I15]